MKKKKKNKDRVAEAAKSVRRKKATRTKRPAVTAAPRQAATDSGLAPGMQAINAYLEVANVAATADFLEKALGFSRGVALSDGESPAGQDGQFRYAEMRHGDSVIMLVRKGDTASVSSGLPALYTYVDDVDGQLVTARAAGAGVEDAQDMPWGDRVSVVTDPDGYRWVLATFKKLVPFT